MCWLVSCLVCLFVSRITQNPLNIFPVNLLSGCVGDFLSPETEHDQHTQLFVSVDEGCVVFYPRVVSSSTGLCGTGSETQSEASVKVFDCV